MVMVGKQAKCFQTRALLVDACTRNHSAGSRPSCWGAMMSHFSLLTTSTGIVTLESTDVAVGTAFFARNGAVFIFDASLAVVDRGALSRNRLHLLEVLAADVPRGAIAWYQRRQEARKCRKWRNKGVSSASCRGGKFGARRAFPDDSRPDRSKVVARAS